MQAVKEKLSDMATMRKIKSDAKEEEKAERDLAKTRMEVAKEVRKAKEAEAEMGMHVAKVGEKVQRHIEKHPGDAAGKQSDQNDPFYTKNNMEGYTTPGTGQSANKYM
ncbi:hypothetical protein ACHQM5_007620 [Ranunculus cassubicifolius]